MDGLNNILFQAHSGIRWLVVLVTVVALVVVIVGWLQKRDFESFARRFMTVFSSLVGLQWLAGIILIIVMGTYTSYQIEHAVTMTLAVVAAHMYLPFKRRPDSTRYVVSLIVILVTLAIVYVGVARLPQGWAG